MRNIVKFGNLTHDIKLEDAIAGGWPLTPHAQLYVEGDLKETQSPTFTCWNHLRAGLISRWYSA